MMKIPIAEPCIGEGELENIIEAVKSGWVSSKGDFIRKFEERFAKYCGRRYGIATSSGTTALHLALAALGIKKKNKVIVPALTFIAVANTVTYCGAKPVFVDSHPDYWCIDPEKIEEKITENTNAIIPVHLYGHPCDMGPILDIAKDHGLYVVEDAAEAHGAEYKNKIVGSFGDISCFSFFGNKIITTGEGGMCLTNNEELAGKMRILRDHGMNPNKRYWFDVIGFNYRMTNLQAAIGLSQLTKINQFIEKKRQIAKLYAEGLNGLEKKGLITLHPEMEWAKCVYWMYSILIEDKFKIERDEVMKKLDERGIETRNFFYPLHILPPYKISDDSLNLAKNISSKGFNLPSSPVLGKNEIKYIVKTLTEMVVR